MSNAQANATIDQMNTEAIYRFAVSEALRNANKWLSGWLDGETISAANAEHIAVGIVAHSFVNTDALVMDGGGMAVDEIAKQLIDRYGPKARAASRIGQHLTDAAILGNIIEDHAEGKHAAEPFAYCNQCIEDHNL